MKKSKFMNLLVLTAFIVISIRICVGLKLIGVDNQGWYWAIGYLTGTIVTCVSWTQSAKETVEEIKGVSQQGLKDCYIKGDDNERGHVEKCSFVEPCGTCKHRFEDLHNPMNPAVCLKCKWYFEGFTKGEEKRVSS